MNNFFIEYLSYSPASGFFHWKKRPSSRAAPGDRAGHLQSLGYRQISLRGSLCYAHRLAWFFCHGVDSQMEIDHINGNRDDNRIENLRECTRSENRQNRVVGLSPSCVAGAYFCNRRKKWVSEIVLNNKKIRVGSFSSLQEAHAAYKEAKKSTHKFQGRVES